MSVDVWMSGNKEAGDEEVDVWSQSVAATEDELELREVAEVSRLSGAHFHLSCGDDDDDHFDMSPRVAFDGLLMDSLHLMDICWARESRWSAQSETTFRPRADQGFN